MAEERPDTRDRGEAEIGRSTGIALPWVLTVVRCLVIRIWVIRMAEAIGRVRRVVRLLAVSTSRDEPRIQSTQSHAGGAGPPHVATASRTRRCTRRSLSQVVQMVIIVRIDETVSPEPMFGQSRRDHCIVVESAGLPPPAEPEQDKEHDCSRGESHDHKDAGDRAFIPEEAEHRQHSQR